MNLFEQYGIKEVAEVTISSIHRKEDGSGELYYVPALYLDTLKVSSVEKTSENTWAQGGIQNSRLVGWDYGKEINLTFEDALCTPASLGLCWGGILSSNWKDGQVNHQFGITDNSCCGGVERISRMEKAFYPRNDHVTVSELLPRDGSEKVFRRSGDPEFLERSSVLDGTEVRGFGYVNSHPYKWHLEIETGIKSVAVVPDRFFSIYGKAYPIKRRQTVGINQPSESFKYEIVYKRGYDKYDDEGYQAKIIYHKQAEAGIKPAYVCKEDDFALSILDDFEQYPYLKIRVCYDGSIRAYLGTEDVDWDQEREITEKDEYKEIEAAKVSAAAEKDTAWIEVPQINTDQFRNIDLWLRFDSINALSYYLLTKYEKNIFEIGPKVIKQGLATKRDELKTALASEGDDKPKVNDVVGLDYNLTTPKVVTGEDDKNNCTPCCKKSNLSRAIWAYVNPKTMSPYDDDYWFSQGEPYYKKSLTLSTKEAKLDAQKIIINQGVFPGMYQIVCETVIRERATGHDKRAQLKFPLCKIKSDQTLTLEADGEPTVFNLDVEVAMPENGIPMEITFYEIEKDNKLGCCGSMVPKDGSTKISAK